MSFGWSYIFSLSVIYFISVYFTQAYSISILILFQFILFRLFYIRDFIYDALFHLFISFCSVSLWIGLLYFYACVIIFSIWLFV